MGGTGTAGDSSTIRKTKNRVMPCHISPAMGLKSGDGRGERNLSGQEAMPSLGGCQLIPVLEIGLLGVWGLGLVYCFCFCKSQIFPLMRFQGPRTVDSEISTAGFRKLPISATTHSPLVSYRPVSGNGNPSPKQALATISPPQGQGIQTQSPPPARGQCILKKEPGDGESVWGMRAFFMPLKPENGFKRPVLFQEKRRGRFELRGGSVRTHQRDLALGKKK